VAEDAKRAQPRGLEGGGDEPPSGRAEDAKRAQPRGLEGGGDEPRSARAEALLVDLDGTLVDSRASVVEAWEGFARRHQLDRGRVLAATFAGPSTEVIATLAPWLDVHAEAEAVEARQVDTADLVVAMPGAAELMAAVPAARMAVVTSGTRPLAEARLAAAGLPVPAVLVSAERVSAGKPDPEGYLLAAALLWIRPERCVVVEDAPAGVRAGRAAGMRVVAVATTHPAEALADAALVVGDLGELPRPLLPFATPAPASGRGRPAPTPPSPGPPGPR
jgi:sugar-phosphatase